MCNLFHLNHLPIKKVRFCSWHVLVLLRRELGHAGIPRWLHSGNGCVPAGTVENALQASILLIEIPGGKVKEATAAAG